MKQLDSLADVDASLLSLVSSADSVLLTVWLNESVSETVPFGDLSVLRCFLTAFLSLKYLNKSLISSSLKLIRSV